MVFRQGFAIFFVLWIISFFMYRRNLARGKNAFHLGTFHSIFLDFSGENCISRDVFAEYFSFRIIYFLQIFL